MATPLQDILYKISYIEADIEIQKRILFSFREDEKTEIEKVMRTIAQAKDDILKLKNQIAEDYPHEHSRMIIIEKSVDHFKELSEKKSFTTIEHMAEDGDLSLQLTSGKKLHCLIKAVDEHKNHTVITIDGELLSFSPEQIVE